MAKIQLSTPFDDKTIENLTVGDVVFISGTVYTSRDMGHLRIAEHLKNGNELPEELSGGVVFHAGPVARHDGEKWQLSVIGPTTSIRMEPYAEMIGRLGVKAIIGKGGMAENSLKQFACAKQVYLQGPPGCAVKLGHCVNEIKRVHWLDMGMPEALWVLDVTDFGPFIVAMDSKNNSIYKTLKDDAYCQVQEWFK